MFKINTFEDKTKWNKFFMELVIFDLPTEDVLKVKNWLGIAATFLEYGGASMVHGDEETAEKFNDIFSQIMEFIRENKDKEIYMEYEAEIQKKSLLINN